MRGLWHATPLPWNLSRIPVDDLHTLAAGHPEYYNGDVHFNAPGIQVQAGQVAAAIEAVLPPR